MIVKLLHATPAPVYVAGIAAMVCRNPDDALELVKNFDSLDNRLENLCKICLKSGHMSVFEHISYTFFVDGISRACSHQLVRHRLASYTQASQRHTKPGNRIMPKGFSGVQAEVWIKAMRDAYQYYDRLVALGTPFEDARSVLPNAASTTIVVTMNARELVHFLELRLCNKAQKEIRELAYEFKALAERHFPLLFKHAWPPCMTGKGCPEAVPCAPRKADKKDEDPDDEWGGDEVDGMTEDDWQEIRNITNNGSTIWTDNGRNA